MLFSELKMQKYSKNALDISFVTPHETNNKNF